MLENLILPNDGSFKEMIHGRTIALIGPANSLRNKGDYINSKETVCRVNRMVLYEDLKEHYGNRCDILFHHGGLKNSGLPIYEELKHELNIEKPKMIFFVRSIVMNDIYSDICTVNNIHFAISGQQCKNSLHKTLPHGSSGMWALMLLIKMQPKNIFMGGFDFYQNPECYYKSPFDFGIYTEIKNKDYNGKDVIDNHYGHNMIEQIKFFERLYSTYKDIIELDDFLQNDLIGNICKRI